ncbi:hypothetical protein QTP86_018992 [Hemibagrus guttatus]|nr:hypothetical protein QTP86_018992 [Hemibagrus guttatus]
MFTVIFMCLWLSLGDCMADSIKPLFTHKAVDEADDVTLSCSYKDFSDTVQNLQWYRQYPKSNPDFLLYIFENGDLSPNIPPRMSAKLKDKQVDLIISSAAVSDSALYYCALAPTVTGNPAALYKNLHTVLLYAILRNSLSLVIHKEFIFLTNVGLLGCSLFTWRQIYH